MIARVASKRDEPKDLLSRDIGGPQEGRQERALLITVTRSRADEAQWFHYDHRRCRANPAQHGDRIRSRLPAELDGFLWSNVFYFVVVVGGWSHIFGDTNSNLVTTARIKNFKLLVRHIRVHPQRWPPPRVIVWYNGVMV